MKKILIIQEIHKYGIDLLKNNKNFEYEITDGNDEKILKEKIKHCDAATIRTAKLPAEVIRNAKKLNV